MPARPLSRRAPARRAIAAGGTGRSGRLRHGRRSQSSDTARWGSDLCLLGARSVLGGYLAVHGAQKLFGAFGGHGLGATSAAFERIGLRPGHVTARAAAVSELGGGVLTALGAAHPVGPVAGTMAVASSTHRANGPLAVKGGFELPLTNMAAALALAVATPGRFSVDAMTGRHLPLWAQRSVVVGAAVSAAVTLAMVLHGGPPPAPGADGDADRGADGEAGEGVSAEHQETPRP